MSSSKDQLPLSPKPTSIASARPTLVFYKHDLRIDDHPGLHAALKSSSCVIPVFCFDPVRYRQLVHSPASAAALVQAVQALRAALCTLGSDLIILSGLWEEEVPRLVAAMDAGAVVAEEEVESLYREGLERTIAALPRGVEVHTWAAPLFHSYSDRFKEWKQQRLEPMQPLDAPSTMPPPPPPSSTMLDLGLLQHDLPSAALLLQEVQKAAACGDEGLLRLPGSTVPAAHSDSEDDVPVATLFSSNTSPSSIEAADGIIDRLPSDPSPADLLIRADAGTPDAGTPDAGPQANNSAWEAELASELAAGEGPVMQALTAYLRHVETAGDGGGSKWQWRLGSAIARYDVPAAPDGCFPALFSRALALGVVSRRRIYSEAASMLSEGGEWEPQGGIFNAIAWLLASSGGATARRQRLRKAAAAAAAAEAGDFHSAMARKREGSAAHGATLRHWRWQGVLTDYLVAMPEHPLHGAPAIMLVHGFGAFSEHWRGNVAALAARGFAVYAPTFPGYGRAEKPSMRYGQDLWRDFLGSFVSEVVRQPVVVAGNSIGGFISASLAADFPGFVRGLVLVNSAGPLTEGYVPPVTPPLPPTPPQFVVEGVSRALFSFLEGDVERQLRRVYPVAPHRADAWLAGEIARAAGDPGALGVFRSVFYLPKPRALNYLVSQAFGGPTLVLQGGKDPLNDAVARAKEIGRLCSNARVTILDAGHCPHDEVCDEVNAALAEFVLQDVMGGDGL